MRSVSPGAPIRRLMKSLGDSMGGGKTTISSWLGLAKRYSNSFTSSTSWICSVGIIEPDGMKNVRITKVIRNSATSPATMNASRYSRMTVRAEGLASPSARTGAGLMLIATRTTAKMQISARSSRGVTARLLRYLFFLDASGLADLVAQVVQPAPADDAALRHFDPVDARAVQQKRFLDADAVRDPPDGDRLGRAAALAHRHRALEHLNAFFAAFDDL